MPTANPILSTLHEIYHSLETQDWADFDLFLETFQKGKEVLYIQSDQLVNITEKIVTNQLIRAKQKMAEILKLPIEAEGTEGLAVDDLLDFGAFLIELESKRTRVKRLSVSCPTVVQTLDLAPNMQEHYRFGNAVQDFQAMLDEHPFFKSKLDILAQVDGYKKVLEELTELLLPAHQQMRALYPYYGRSSAISQIADDLKRKYCSEHAKDLIRDVTDYRQECFYNWFEAIREVKLYTNRERKKYNAKYGKERAAA